MKVKNRERSEEGRLFTPREEKYITEKIVDRRMKYRVIQKMKRSKEFIINFLKDFELIMSIEDENILSKENKKEIIEQLNKRLKEE